MTKCQLQSDSLLEHIFEELEKENLQDPNIQGIDGRSKKKFKKQGYLQRLKRVDKKRFNQIKKKNLLSKIIPITDITEPDQELYMTL